MSMKISANQSMVLSVLFFNLLLSHWQETFHCVFHHVNLLNICSRQAFYSINLSNFGFFIINQFESVVLKLYQKLKMALTHMPLPTLIEIAWQYDFSV